MFLRFLENTRTDKTACVGSCGTVREHLAWIPVHPKKKRISFKNSKYRFVANSPSENGCEVGDHQK